jgi:Bifunctional DNA primase/polymerase, N-terminal
MSDDVCQLAINLARNCGYATFPVRADKKPACPHGFQDAAKNPEAIAELWRRWPAPLIGIATGAVSGVDIVDVDCGRWPDDAKPETIAKHEAARAWWHVNSIRIPPTRIHASASAGLHLYLLHHPGIGSNQSRIALGVDVRGDGGYAVHWFSAGCQSHVHEPPCSWPDWLLDANTEKPPAAGRRARTPRTEEVEQVISRAIQLAADASEGSKHVSVRKASRLLGGIQLTAGFSNADATGWILDVLPQTVRDWRNAAKTIEYGLAKGREQPIEVRSSRHG